MAYKRIEIDSAAVSRQVDICREIKERFAAGGKTPLAMVDTYGCQQNEADSERIRGYLAEMGCGFTQEEREADIVVVNSCAVREHAEMRILGNVGALTHTKKINKDQIIVLCGCMVQQEHIQEKVKKSYRIVDLVFGPHRLWQFPELLQRVLTEKGRVFAADPSEGEVIEGMPQRRDGTVKAWLSIMYGCNNFCTYCVVPFVRGRERSRKPETIIEEAKQLIADGYKDITLLGQNVNSYGKDLEEDVDFSDLLRRVNEIDGDFTIRFMTSHPKDAGEKLFKTMAECKKCARHIHLPFQAGNDRVLKAMNRGYDFAAYLEKVRLARKYIPDIVLTSDIIVGFPGETDLEFEDTIKMLEAVRFDALFTFIYSPRVGTPAAEMQDDATREDKQKRFDRLLAVQNKISEEKHAEYVGKTLKVLIDGESGDEIYPLTGRTSGGRLVRLGGSAEIVGQYTQVRITDSKTWALFGEIEGEK